MVDVMHNRKERELSEIKNSIIRTQFVSMIAMLFIGLSVYGLFVAKGSAFHPALNNQYVLNTMLVAGILLEIRHIVQLIPLLKRYSRLKHQHYV